MLPNWLLGKSKSKLQEILSGGGGGGTTYTAGEGIDITNQKISVDPLLMNDIEQTTLAIPTKAALTQITNPNLLDNPWFTVSQRGASGTITATGYFIDRWKCGTADSVSYDATNHTITTQANSSTSTSLGYAEQILDSELTKNILGKTVTLSIAVDGHIYSGTRNIAPAGTITDIQIYPFEGEGLYLGLHILANGTNITIRIRKSSSKAVTSHIISAVKLELGSVSTLAMDTAPNYATELAKCQRYFERIIGAQTLGTGYCGTNNTAYIYTKISPKRTNPTIALNGTVYCWHGSNIGTSGIECTALQDSKTASKEGNVMLPLVLNNAGIVGESVLSQIRDNTSYIDFDAEL